MSVDWAVYHDGSRQERRGDLHEVVAGLAGAPSLAAADNTFVWIELVDPTRAELESVAAEFDLHPLAVEDAVAAHQRPKLERYGDGLFLVLKTLRYVRETSDVELGEVAVFVGPAHCVTVRHGRVDPLPEARRRVERQREDHLECGPSAILHAVCDSVVDTYLTIAGQIEDDLEEVEARVFSEDRRPDDAEIIYRLKREVLEFRRAARPLAEPMSRLARGDEPLVHPTSRPYFRDIHDHLVRVVESIDTFDTQLTDMLNANLTQVGVRQNDDMRRISAWAAMVTVPTFIAGLYGMNFEHMPELGARFGYPVALGVMALVCVVLHRAFKRSGWL